MSPPEKEDDAKRSGVIRFEPLCLFCFAEGSPLHVHTTYVNPLPKKEPVRGFGQKVQEVQSKEKEEFWLRKRAEARIRRRRMKEPIRNLQTFLLSSERCDDVPQKSNLPSLIEVLEVVKDAWPSPPSRKKPLLRDDDRKPSRFQRPTPKFKMKDQKVSLEFLPRLLNRRFSVPEELMRKFSVSKERTSEESETNKTAADVSPSTSSVETTETVRKVTGREKRGEGISAPATTADACQQTGDAEQVKRPEMCKRVTQNDYYDQGRRIIKMKVEKGCSCERGEPSSTAGSAKEDTEESESSESAPSSSPTQLPKRESSSGNLSSESDCLRCTCAELTSTSTDLFRSGKSTLSQTISDKSTSTQDSTMSINSVSSRGSTESENSDSTTPDKRTSAKETTTSPDYSPRTPRNKRNRRCCHRHKKTCPRHVEEKHSKRKKRCPMHSECQSRSTVSVATNTEDTATRTTEKAVELPGKNSSESRDHTEEAERHKRTKLSQEELYLMQQLRHRRFVESQRRLTHPPSPTPEADSISVYGKGSTYKETENVDELVMIPRYSALPRTLSMLVNTSSADTSHNSDSDNQSLADSLEDQPTTHVHKLYFDTKKESKPVRGDASFVQDDKPRPRQPRGRAFFVSIKDPYGEDEMLEHIDKIPQPPEKIKNQIFERHLSLCSKHKYLREGKVKESEGAMKKKKGKSKQEEAQSKKKEARRGEGKAEGVERKRSDENSLKEEGKAKKEKSRSKIPVLASGRSTSSSPEEEGKEKAAWPKGRLRREKQPEEVGDGSKSGMEITQILEITQSGPEISLQKAQGVSHPPGERKSDLIIPPLVPGLKVPPFRQLNKQLLPPARKSPIGKFRQRFEVIPEEKSSSLSSAEEKNGEAALPRFADASTSPASSEKIPLQKCNANVIVAKLANQQLDALPYVNSDGQKIFLLSKSQNSAKGRDALIAMNQEDFRRLAKGWMNFYKISECGDAWGVEDHAGGEAKRPDDSKLKEPELEEPVRFHSSNTILKAKPTDSGEGEKKQRPLSELKEDGCDVDGANGALKGREDEDEESDSDSTDYMEPPSPRVPPLPIGDVPSDATLSSTDSELEEPKPQVTTMQQLKRRTTNRARPRKDKAEFTRLGRKKNSGWSVTVAGTVELSRSAPDLEMRLSFPVKADPSAVSQSDSGFAEDSHCSKLSKSFQELSSHGARKALAGRPGNEVKQHWMVTVKNPKKGAQEQAKQASRGDVRLPDLGGDRSAKKEFKDVQLEMNLKRIVERKIWPKVKKIIQKEFSSGRARMCTGMEEEEDESGLSVRGSAVSLERKQRPPTMTERDVTKRSISKTEAT